MRLSLSQVVLQIIVNIECVLIRAIQSRRNPHLSSDVAGSGCLLQASDGEDNVVPLQVIVRRQ